MAHTNRDDEAQSVLPEMIEIYRPEALEARIRQPRLYGNLLRISPPWIEGAFWFLVAVVVAGGIGFLVMR